MCCIFLKTFATHLAQMFQMPYVIVFCCHAEILHSGVYTWHYNTILASGNAGGHCCSFRRYLTRMRAPVGTSTISHTGMVRCAVECGSGCMRKMASILASLFVHVIVNVALSLSVLVALTY